MGKRRFLLTVGTKLPIATVGRQITLTAKQEQPERLDDQMTMRGKRLSAALEARRIVANIAKLPELLRKP
jgi:hypothetical protein